MNKEKYNHFISDVYKNYLIEDAKILPNMSKEKMTELGYRLSQEQFINKIKTDPEFSEKWGLKIEERELSLEERQNLYFKLNPEFRLVHENMNKQMDNFNIPTKLITLTYNNEKIESYE